MTTRIFRLTLLALTLKAACLGIPARQALAAPFQFELQVRANLADGHLLPTMSSFTQSTALVNDDGQVSATLVVIAGAASQGLWVGRNGSGRVVHQTSDESILVGTHTQSSDGRVLFSRFFDNGIAEGLFRYDPLTDETTKVLEAGLSTPHVAFSAPTAFSDGSLAFRSTEFEGGRSLMIVKDGVSRVLAREVPAEASSPFSFIFAPAMNEAGWVAAKVTRTDGRTALAVWAPGESIHREVPLGDLEGLNNGISLGPDGRLAFLGHLPGNHRGIFVWNGTKLTEIASTRDGRLKELAWFSPSVNRNGLVAFRGKNNQGRHAIFVGDGHSLIEVVAEHDILPSDKGPARIDQNDDSHPVFAGGVSINSSNVLVFRAALSPPDDNQVEWGEGIYKVQVLDSMP